MTRLEFETILNQYAIKANHWVTSAGTEYYCKDGDYKITVTEFSMMPRATIYIRSTRTTYLMPLNNPNAVPTEVDWLDLLKLN